MKKLFKIFVNFTAVALMAVCSLGLAACEDIKSLELSLTLYNGTDKVFYAEDDVKFSVDFYRHLAPETVDGVLELVKKGYYSDAIFYQFKDENTSQIMIGDLKLDENFNLVQNLIDGKQPPVIRGEFKYNGVTGSNLVSEKGSIGLWRSYYESGSYTTSSAARDSGRATWFIPTATITSYDGYYCIFAQYDTADTANAKAISALSAIFASTDYYTEYVVYYTGDYDAEKADANYGLKFNAMTKTAFDELDEKPEVFEAEGDELVCFNKKTVKIPMVKNSVYAKVNSVKVK